MVSERGHGNRDRDPRRAGVDTVGCRAQMAAQRSKDEDRFREIRIVSTYYAAKQPEEEILRAVQEAGYDEEAAFAIKLALEEAMTNAVKHGNCNDCNKGITVRYNVTPETVVIIVRDEGCGFEPDSVPDPTAPERIILPNGRGIMLMRAYMDEVCYRDSGREVYLMKRHR